MVRARQAAWEEEKGRVREAVTQARCLKTMMVELFGSEVEWDKPKVSRQLVVLPKGKPAKKSPKSPRAAPAPPPPLKMTVRW